jgi:hypothetical protein
MLRLMLQSLLYSVTHLGNSHVFTGSNVGRLRKVGSATGQFEACNTRYLLQALIQNPESTSAIAGTIAWLLDTVCVLFDATHNKLENTQAPIVHEVVAKDLKGVTCAQRRGGGASNGRENYRTRH